MLRTVGWSSAVRACCVPARRHTATTAPPAGDTTAPAPPSPTPQDEERARERRAAEQARRDLARAEQQGRVLRRALVECEDARAAAARTHAEQQAHAVRKLARDMLAVHDVLARAAEQPSREALALVARDMLARLGRHGVAPLPPARQCAGAAFDPAVHNAIAAAPLPPPAAAPAASPASAAAPAAAAVPKPNTIAQVFKSGYMLNGRLLRPADVSVYIASQ